MFVLLLFLATGMFYPVLSIACSIYMGGYFVWLQKKHKKTIRLNGIDAACILLAVFYFLSVIWAVDKGMALIGASRWLSLVWMCLIIKQWDTKQQEFVVRLLPWFASGTVVLSALLYFTPAKDAFFVAGRLAGPFGYANSYAMFLLIAVGILLAREQIFEPKAIILLAILLCGILWTASRTVGILALILLAYHVGKMIIAGKHMKRNIIVILALFVLLAMGCVIPQVRGLYQRMADISLHSSTFLGRLLYAQDSFQLIRRFPFGLGAFGYSYVNGITATGLYQIKYVHQALLQLILDIGIGPAVVFLVILIYGIKKAHIHVNPYVPIMVLAMLHAMFDIDMEYMTIPMILVFLLQSKSEDNRRQLPVRVGVIFQLLLSVASVLLLPVMIANLFYLSGNYDGALAVCPFYTDARELRMEESFSLEEIQQDAYTLVKNNPYSAKGYQMMGTLAYLDGNYEEMQMYLDRELELVPYQNTEYEMYEEFLLEIIEQNEDDQELVVQCESKLQELDDLKRGKLSHMSELGKQIADQPKFKLKGE